MSTLQMITLALIAGGFISFDAIYYTVVMTNADDAFGSSRMCGGISFSLGFILVIIAGAELFTGNNMPLMHPPSTLDHIFQNIFHNSQIVFGFQRDSCNHL
jgi:formate/nitrite transporter FocA (FNT family)